MNKKSKHLVITAKKSASLIPKWTGAERRKLEVTGSRFYEAELNAYARNANAAPLGELRCDSLLP